MDDLKATPTMGIVPKHLWLQAPMQKELALQIAKERGFVMQSGEDYFKRSKTAFHNCTQHSNNEELGNHFLAVGRFLLWVAACCRHKDAVKYLMNELASVNYDFEARAGLKMSGEQFSDICESWVSFNTYVGVDNKVKMLPLHRPAEREEEIAGFIDFEDEKSPKVTTSTSNSKNGRVVVVADIGDPDSSDARNIRKRYSNVIGKSIPLSAVMPPKGFIQQEIEQEWPWAANVAARLERKLDMQRSMGIAYPKLKPLLFVGEPESGKTALARRLTDLFKMKSVLVPVAGTADSASLAAVTRGWNSAKASLPVSAMSDFSVADPAIIVDEIDKGSLGSHNGSAAGTLMGMLGTPEAFFDGCLLANVDLTHVMFIATANDINRIPDALLDRFEVYTVNRPRAEHFATVLATMQRRYADELGVHPMMLPSLDNEEYSALKDAFTARPSSLRSFERNFKFVMGEANDRENGNRMMN